MKNQSQDSESSRAPSNCTGARRGDGRYDWLITLVNQNNDVTDVMVLCFFKLTLFFNLILVWFSNLTLFCFSSQSYMKVEK